MKSERKEDIPYGAGFNIILDRVYKALEVCCIAHDEGEEVFSKDCFSKVKKAFNFKNIKSYPYKARGINRHLSADRMAMLTCQLFESATKHGSKKANKTLFLPSPLQIILQCLTVPTEPHSDAYALSTCRSYLFSQLHTYPETYLAPISSEKFSPMELRSEYETLRKYTRHRDSRPPVKKKTYLVLSHFLAMRGALLLRFGTDSRNKAPLSESATKVARLEFCKRKRLFHESDDVPGLNPEFRLSNRYQDLFSFDEIFNQILGIPVPIRGFHTIFQGALKTSSDGSLVVHVSGAPGTGKTSFALALSASLASLGSTCYYMSSEESIEDLKIRVSSLIPEYLKSTSLYKSSIDKWFFPRKINLSSSDTNQFRENNIDQIKSLVKGARAEMDEDDIPTICPLVVVIDSITGLIEQGEGANYSELEHLVSACRDIGVVVVLLSGEDLRNSKSLDYLVDSVICLKLKDTDNITSKPRRVLELLKTRQQSSRPGSHIFHIDGNKGVRVSPQLASQIDKRQNEIKHLPDVDSLIHTFNICNEKDTKIFSTKPRFRNLDLYEKSQILLHGLGSSGKAALGLKILTMPIIRRHMLPKYPSRVLVLSFLYPPAYYDEILVSLNRLRANIYPRLAQDPELECIYFYPGFITPEDFVGKVSRAIEIAQLSGAPFTGILIDGLHNVFLQFPMLQESTMVWPMLYNLLSRVGITTVSTFTTFEIGEGEESHLSEGVHYRKHEPFLHALVQASDFKIRLMPAEGSTDSAKHPIQIDNVINQSKPRKTLRWNSADLVIETIGDTDDMFD